MLGEWNVKRVLGKVNYTIHTDAVRDFVIPKMDVEREKLYAYADGADLLNLALCNVPPSNGGKPPWICEKRNEHQGCGKHQRTGCAGQP
ncbi:MAG: hypothetical protein LBR26_14515 [Prevotella sp.]|nr:hypothetical protein [Prevotella sp.]